jgi:integrase
MARVKRSDRLRSIEARRELPIRREPYFMVIEKGLALGYRRSNSAGAWLVRRYDPTNCRNAEARLATADDYRPSDGVDVLTFAEAQRKAMAEQTALADQASGKTYTVADAVTDYIEHQRQHRKGADDTAIKLNAYAVSFLGEKRIGDLQPSDFDEWLKWALKRQARRKPKKPKPEPSRRRKLAAKATSEAATRAVLDPDELRRRRKSTLNRVITSLKAVLNHAHDRGKVASRDAWVKLKKFKGVDAARLRWLTLEEAKRLTNAAAPDLRHLMQGGLMTGCRPGELSHAKAGDFDPQSETLLVAESKTGKPRRVPLTKEGVALLESLTAGKRSSELIFSRADGSPWNRVAVIRGMQAASTAGNITPPATFYALRHTYASHPAQKGIPLLFVASALGHRDARMVEKHYGHFAPSHVAEAIKAKLPTFGIKVDRKVSRLRARS